MRAMPVEGSVSRSNCPPRSPVSVVIAPTMPGSRHQNRKKPGHFKISVVSARPLLFVRAAKVGLENRKRLLIVPRVRKRHGSPCRTRPKQGHARRQYITGERTAPAYLPRQSRDSPVAGNMIAQE